jgi:hypothetical protein
MTAPTLVTIVATNDDLATDLQAFSDVIPASAVWNEVSSEYGVGALTSAVHLTGPSMSGSYTTDQLRSYVASVIAGDAGPAPNGNTVYLLYLPTGATFGACSGSCGCHQNYPSDTSLQGDSMAFVQRCPPYGEDTQLGELTNAASHEVVEAATNPAGMGYNFRTALVAGTSDIWAVFNGADVELADPCEGTRTLEVVDGGPGAGWEFQRIWSNTAAAKGGDPCIPAAADPYFSVSVPQDWYAVNAGGTVTIPMTGWSVGATGAWFLNRGVSTGSGSLANIAETDGGAVISSQLGVESPTGCGPRYAINNGDTASITVTAPSDAQSGDYAVLSVNNFREQPSPVCNPLLSADHLHFWPVGVYVP